MSAVPERGRPDAAAAHEEALGAFSRRLAEALDLPGLPRAAAERAAVDPLYLHGLVARRDAPEAVARLIAEPCGTSLPKWAPRPTPVLIAGAAYALARWAAAGFGQVSPEAAERRRRACLACPELRAPGGRAIHRLVGATGGVCRLCSCAVERKAMLPTESCPAPAPDDPALSRWGEPRG
ncbi:hypothetical protein [Methylobacterium indicum]|uniref:hypothetical protein n=1 Tax=Methylobacterium indicum TaxID=1775910 RepID=UPI002434FAA6|nr:hypothetical protein [Methylobacterium indicum]